MLKNSSIVLWLPRLLLALNYSWTLVSKTIKWSFNSRETSTYTYELSARNYKYLIHTISVVTKKSYSEIDGYFNEVLQNVELKNYVINKIKSSTVRYKKDLRCDFASRIGWYAIIRANKSRVVVENGVELGYTAVILCEAILKNQSEGFNGFYYGLDINSDAGYFVKTDRYNNIYKLIVGDALDSISYFTEPIDFYFSDGFRTNEYELKEFDALSIKLAQNAIIVSNKLKLSDALADFSLLQKKQFVTFQEEPLNHWYPGSSIGILY